MEVGRRSGTPRPRLEGPSESGKGSQVGAHGIDLLEKFMSYDPKKRWTARKGLQHAYFEDIRPFSFHSLVLFLYRPLAA